LGTSSTFEQYSPRSNQVANFRFKFDQICSPKKITDNGLEYFGEGWKYSQIPHGIRITLSW